MWIRAVLRSVAQCSPAANMKPDSRLGFGAVSVVWMTLLLPQGTAAFCFGCLPLAPVVRCCLADSRTGEGRGEGVSVYFPLFASAKRRRPPCLLEIDRLQGQGRSESVTVTDHAVFF